MTNNEDFSVQTVEPPQYCSHGLIDRMYMRGLKDFEHVRTICVMCSALLYKRATDWKSLGLDLQKSEQK